MKELIRIILVCSTLAINRLSREQLGCIMMIKPIAPRPTSTLVMSVKVPSRLRSDTPSFPASKRNSNKSRSLNSVSSLYHNIDQFGPSFVPGPSEDSSTPSPGSTSAVSQVRHHPYIRPERHRAYTTGAVSPPHTITNRPDIFHPPTLLVGLRVSEAIISNRAVSKSQEDYPTVPVRFKCRIIRNFH